VHVFFSFFTPASCVIQGVLGCLPVRLTDADGVGARERTRKISYLCLSLPDAAVESANKKETRGKSHKNVYLLTRMSPSTRREFNSFAICLQIPGSVLSLFTCRTPWGNM
jgi:hypothetical protein